MYFCKLKHLKSGKQKCATVSDITEAMAVAASKGWIIYEHRRKVRGDGPHVTQKQLRRQ